MDPRRYPSPVRPVGSGSSTTRCVTANGGTQLDLSTMNRVLKIERDRVTVQPGISLTELADILSDEGLELIGGFDLANRTVGGAVSAAGLEASMAGDVGQFASHVLQLKVLSPNGKKFVVSEKTKSLLALMRLSYGLLGVIYEVTLRVRPVQGFAVQTAKVSFKDFGKLGPKLLERDGRREALSAAVPRPHLPRAAPSRRRSRSGPQVRLAAQGLGRLLGAARSRPLDRHGRADSPDPLSA